MAQLVSRHSCVANRLPVVVRFPAERQRAPTKKKISTSDSEAEDAVDQRPEFLEAGRRWFMNNKFLVIHCERTEGILKCGRRVSPFFFFRPTPSWLSPGRSTKFVLAGNEL